jgi:hypothetical protein
VTTDSIEPTAGTSPEVLVDPFSGSVIDLEGVEDDGVIDIIADAEAARDAYLARFNTLLGAAKQILESRIRARGARSVPHQLYVVELEPVNVEDPPDLDALREAQKHLPPHEAAKVLRHVPEFVPDPIPAHDEPGLAVSINALRRKYAGTIVDDLLAKGRPPKRAIDTRFVFKRRKGAEVNVTPASLEGGT